MMNRVLTTVLGGLLLLAGAAQAADQSYALQGSRLPSDGAGYLEVFGYAGAGQEPYANIGALSTSRFDYLIAGSRAASNAALASFSAASATLSYDPALAPLSTAANGRSARYPAGPLSIILDAGSSSVPMSTSDLVLLVNRSANGSSQNVAFTRAVGTVEGPLSGIVFSYSAPPAAPLAADLVALVDPASGALSRGFDLSGFDSLPIRLEAPTVFRPVTLSLQMSRSGPAGSFDIAPPASLSLQDWSGASLSVVFDGVYGVAVDRADYASDEAHAAASAWVSTHIRQIDFETVLDFNVSSISAVPEPASALLLALGLGGLLSYRRWRRC